MKIVNAALEETEHELDTVIVHQRAFITAPTAFRAIKKEDPEGQLKAPYGTSKLRYLFLAGERCDVNTLQSQ